MFQSVRSFRMFFIVSWLKYWSTSLASDVFFAFFLVLKCPKRIEQIKPMNQKTILNSKQTITFFANYSKNGRGSIRGEKGDPAILSPFSLRLNKLKTIYVYSICLWSYSNFLWTFSLQLMHIFYNSQCQ